MKKSKVFIILSVCLLVLLGVWFGYNQLAPPPPPPPLPSSPMVNYYKSRIDSIRDFSSSTFCVKLFADTYSHLENCRADTNLGVDNDENERIYAILRSDLCAAYSQKFLEQSKEIVNGTVWNRSDMNVIKDELDHLLGMNAFDAESAVSSGVFNIRSIVSEYFQIQNFISACNSYYFPYSSLNSIDIPIVVPSFFSLDYSNTVSIIGGYPLSNCPYLSSDLDNAKVNLMNKHYISVKNKIESFASLPVPYSMQSYVPNHFVWSSLIYQPLKNDIDLLDTNPYDLTDISAEVDDLNSLLATKDTDAAYYTFP